MSNTKHKSDCNMAFGRKDPSCPRCQELLNGATPRQGWGRKSRYTGKTNLDVYCFKCPCWAVSPCKHGKIVYTD
jgi:hypothetical protein